MREEECYLGFSVFPGIGPVTFAKLLKQFDSAKAAWIASEEALATVLHLKKAKEFVAFCNSFSFADYQKKLTEKNVRVVAQNDPLYPRSLLKIPNPPIVLFAKGNVAILNNTVIASGTKQSQKDGIAASSDVYRSPRNDKAIAVVGTRIVTQYGREVTALFTKELALSGCVIVSGLALGVDAIAHKVALENNAETIAVLGCGVDCCSPRENESLYNEIVARGGVVLSEVPLGHGPTKGTFPARNRIIAGLSSGILVTEGAEDSGSLITADYGLKFGKKVFAVPGPITSSLSKGPYKLIQKGAVLVTKAEDLLEAVGLQGDRGDIKVKGKIKGDTKEEQEILNLLSHESLSFDVLVRKTGLQSAALSVLLSLLEVKGSVILASDGSYSLVL